MEQWPFHSKNKRKSQKGSPISSLIGSHLNATIRFLPHPPPSPSFRSNISHFLNLAWSRKFSNIYFLYIKRKGGPPFMECGNMGVLTAEFRCYWPRWARSPPSVSWLSRWARTIGCTRAACVRSRATTRTRPARRTKRWWPTRDCGGHVAWKVRRLSSCSRLSIRWRLVVPHLH